MKGELIAVQKIPASAPEASLLKQKQDQGYAALEAMENHLSSNDYFVGNRYSAADIALYACARVAEEGNIGLDPCPAVSKWLTRIARQPGHVTIDERK